MGKVVEKALTIKLFPEFSIPHTLFTLLLFWVLLEVNYAEEPKGFGDQHFGMSKQNVVESLIKKYGFENTEKGIKGNNGSWLHHAQSTIWMDNFPLGKNKVTVWMFFNANDKFYKFEFEGPGYAFGSEDEGLKKSSEFFCDVFQTKYGLPEKKYPLSFLNIKEGYLSFTWKWSFEGKTAYTAYKLEGKKAAALATVVELELEKEVKISREKSPSQGVQDAVEAF